MSGKKIIRHPHFNLAVSSKEEKHSEELVWRIDPRDGILRYTLVHLNKGSGETVCAIYHHLNWELSFPSTYSEGVLLLPETHSGTETEEIVVASLLGVLARLRMSNNPPRKGNSWLGRMVRGATRASHQEKL